MKPVLIDGAFFHQNICTYFAKRYHDNLNWHEIFTWGFSSSKKNVNEKTLRSKPWELCVCYGLYSEMTKYSSFSCKNVFRQKIERVRVELVRTD